MDRLPRPFSALLSFTSDLPSSMGSTLARSFRGISLLNLCALFFAALLTACGGNDDGPVGLDPDNPQFEGSFTATFSGLTDITTSGVAIFGAGTDPSSGQPTWVVYLVKDPNNPAASAEAVYFVGTNNLSQQTYALSDPSANGGTPASGVTGMAFVTSQSGTFGTFVSEAGTLQITSQTSSRLDGTFTFNGEGTLIEGGQSTQGAFTIQGSFEAQNGNFLLPPTG